MLNTEVTIMDTDTDLDTITMGQLGGLEVDGVEAVEEVLVEALVHLRVRGQLQVLEEHDDDKHCFFLINVLTFATDHQIVSIDNLPY